MSDLGPECRVCRLVRGRHRPATHRDADDPQRFWCDDHARIDEDEPLPGSERARLEAPPELVERACQIPQTELARAVLAALEEVSDE